MILGLLEPADLPEPMALRREAPKEPGTPWWVRVGHWVLALIVLGVLVGGTGWALSRILEPDNLRMEGVRLDGEVHHLTRELLKRTLANEMGENFFRLDLAQVRTVLEKLPWVARVSVRRVWPRTLEIWVEERQPLARWGDQSLVTANGDIFTPEPDTLPKELPRLMGPDQSAKEVCDRYIGLRDRLRGQGLDIAGLTLSDRHAWTLALSGGGLMVQLGSRDFELRLERFLRYRERLQRQGDIQSVDLRYSNGFAVRLLQRPPEPGQKAARKEGGRA